MGLPALGKMKDEDYKLLSPEQLMMYNKDLPVLDYSNPYMHKEFPRAMFHFEAREDGSGTLSVVKVDDEKALSKLLKSGGDWRRSPGDWGIETAKGAPEFAISNASIDIPAPAPHVAAAGA